MSKNLEMFNPKNLDEVVDWIVNTIKEEGSRTEEEVKKNGIPHFGFGMYMRNSLKLWWQPDWTSKEVDEFGELREVPTPKPPIVQYFNDMDIYHADDMSGTISEAVTSKLKGEPFDVKQHIQRYFKHWKKQGFKNGIFKPENRKE